MKTAVQTDRAPAAIGPYQQAVRTEGWLWVSGQLGLDPATGALAEGFEAQTRQVFANLTAILEAAGSTWDHVVKTSVFLADLNDFPALNALYQSVVRPPYPARETVQVARLPRDARIEISLIAHAP
ncbi:MAG: Rid family detoxifying hydrolase [Kiritimatiellae bacterium]|nr:Rid family detoxifying hydrolase [Kiritimatiellia bacterium]